MASPNHSITNIVVLAAGAGARLRSALPKPLHTVGGVPMLERVLRVARALKPVQLVVVAPPDSQIASFVNTIDNKARCVVQPHANGTADAARCALPQLRNHAGDNTLILCGDTPLVRADTLRGLCKAASKEKAVCLLSFITEQPYGYGRIVRADMQASGEVLQIVEERDASPAVRKIQEVYAGMMVVPTRLLTQLLKKVRSDNKAAECYLTDVVALARAAGGQVCAVVTDEEECLGVNSQADLMECERLWQEDAAWNLMKQGVRLMDASRLDVRGHVAVRGRDVVIDVNVVLEGEITLGEGCVIGANCVLRDCRIGAGSVVEPFSHLHGVRVGARCRIGPYARIRPDSVVGDDSKIGNFVEVKKSKLASGVKAGHLSYIGDSTLGAGVNVGAGTITCNYDGQSKHATIIEPDVFIGSGTQLVAPVRVRRGAYIGAGSTITKSVPSKALAVARARQKNVSPARAEAIQNSKNKKKKK